MKERQIFFNSEMVRAILEGKKTQTRRVIKPQPEAPGFFAYEKFGFKFYVSVNEPGAIWRCPYGIPGDQLWVRETWFPMQDIEACVIAGEPVEIAYKADYDADGISREEARDVGIDRWRPSIFMPRWASRITLEVIKVRVEQVQDISMHDALSEGADPLYSDFHDGSHCIGWFKRLWNSIYTKRGFGWKVNPWVWVVEFKVFDE